VAVASSLKKQGAKHVLHTTRMIVGSPPILDELHATEKMMQAELNGHPEIVREEMQLLHGAEDVVRRGHMGKHGSELIQQKHKDRQTFGTGRILGELSMAEKMIQKELKGHPKIVQEEMQLLHGAEDSLRHSPHSSGLIQQKGSVSAGVGAGQMLNELGTVENMVEKALKGHPEKLSAEEHALQVAEDAARALQNPRAGSLVEVTKSGTESLQELHAGAAQLEVERRRSMATALKEERSYSTAERRLSEDGQKVLSQFSTLEDSIAQAFAGKDSNAVKTAMQVGELLEKARGEQKQVQSLNAKEASVAGKHADALAAVFAQSSAESKAMQEQRAYTTGMTTLVKDEKSTLSEFSGLKSAVAQAFAGKDGNAVEKAMEVGELLDRAREGQRKVTEEDAKDAADASALFRELGHRSPHHSAERTKAFLQSRSLSAAGLKAAHESRLKSLASRESSILHLTEHAEDAITRELSDEAKTAKDGGHAAMSAEHEVISILENARHAEEAAYAATKRAAGHAHK
jgi:uncharacterized protein YneF (UPF0154 family)